MRFALFLLFSLFCDICFSQSVTIPEGVFQSGLPIWAIIVIALLPGLITMVLGFLNHKQYAQKSEVDKLRQELEATNKKLDEAKMDLRLCEELKRDTNLKCTELQNTITQHLTELNELRKRLDSNPSN